MRNMTVEYLRVVLMTLVVLLHLLYAYYPEGGEILPLWNRCAIDGLKSLVHLGVTGFIFISGYYGVSLKWNKVTSLYIQITTYCLLSLILMAVVFGESFNICKLVNVFLSLFDGPWFTSYYFLLMLLSPIINKGCHLIDKRTFSMTIILLLFIMYFAMWLHKRPAAISLYLFVIIYITARYLAIYPIAFIERNRNMLFAASLAMLVGIPIMLNVIGKQQYVHLFQGNFCVLNLMTFVPSFYICQSKKVNGKGHFLTKGVLAIFLIHTSPFGLELLKNHIATPYCTNIPMLVMISMCTVVICCVIEKLRSMAMIRFESECVNRLNTLLNGGSER